MCEMQKESITFCMETTTRNDRIHISLQGMCFNNVLKKSVFYTLY